MPLKEQYIKIDKFRGLGNPFSFSSDPTRVRFMRNITSQFGRLVTRKGYELLGNVPATQSIAGFADFKKTDNTVTLVRWDLASTAGVARKYNITTGLWDSIGALDAITTGAKFRVDSVMHNDKLWFIYAGQSDPANWTGTGNISEVAAGPTGRFITSFGGRLLVGYASGGLNPPTTIFYDDADNGTTWTGTTS